MREKVGHIISVVIGWGIYTALIAGGLTFFGFVFAVIIRGGLGQQIAVFIHRTIFPCIIQVTAFTVILGLAGMIVKNEQALSLKTDKDESVV